ncbi:putative Histidine kinase [Verrucomicrobia bacterium]|nr:putative Histidine kinase [Verrucomicrobiota bacterium]
MADLRTAWFETMSYSLIHTIVLSLFPCLIPPYAFRLSRVFGTQRVGWVLVASFSLLAALELVGAWHPMRLGLDPGLALDLLNFLVPVLLLIGMVHIEIVFKERLRVEEQEQRLRSELELQVKERTAELDRANEELRHEITLRMQGEEELRKSKEQYRFLFDENPQPMWIYNLSSFAFLAFNRAALRHYGFTSEEFRELTARDLYPPGDVEGFVADSEKASAELRRGLCRHRKKDGSLLEVEVICQDLRCAGEPARLVLAHDVTAQRRLQKQLLQAQKAEVTAKLAGGIGDNFGKLITIIEADAKGLLDNCADPGAVEPLKRMAATAGAAASLTHQLLALVRRHPMRPQAVDLNQLIEEQGQALSRELGSKIKLQKNYGTNLPPILADPRLIEQILHNLIRNAQEAMPEGGSLTLATAKLDLDEGQARRQEGARPGPCVSLTVADTGCGMTPEVQSCLFEPFFTTKSPGNATGLGLATVQGLVKQHDGWIDVNSQPGGGSRLTVFFPCSNAVPRAAY